MARAGAAHPGPSFGGSEHIEDRRWRERIEGWTADWWKVVEERAMNDADPVNGQRVLTPAETVAS